MLTAEEILLRFHNAISFEPLELAKHSIIPEGTLLEKLNARLGKLPDPRIRFTSFNFIGGYEIGNLTGNQLIRLFIQILNSKEDCSVSNCILFTVNSQQCGAMAVYKPEQIEVTSSPPDLEDLKNRFVFTKLFDDDMVKQSRILEHPFYTEEFVTELRKNLSVLFEKFLHNQIADFCDERFVKSFIGVIFEIAKVHSNRNHKYQILNTVPVAACVKLALDSNQSGKLQRVFGQHGLNTKQWYGNIMKANSNIQKNCKKENAHVHVLKRKASLRKQAVIEIMKKVSPPNEKGFWDESVVEDIINEMKLFYQVN